MAYQIVSFLLDIAASLFGGACLLRLYMQFVRAPFRNPVGRFVFALSDWIVLPLRKVLPAMGRIDTASLVAAIVIEFAQYALRWVMLGQPGSALSLVGVTVFGVLRLALSGLMGLVILGAILSWVRADSPVVDVIDRLCAPLLRPFRRLIPLVGGIDLSPLAFLVVCQIAVFVLLDIAPVLGAAALLLR